MSTIPSPYVRKAPRVDPSAGSTWKGCTTWPLRNTALPVSELQVKI